MKKIILILLLLCLTVTSYARDRNLYERFKDAPHIKVYLKEVTSGIKDPHVDINMFKRIFKKVLEKRLNIKFISVDRAAGADVIVTARIKKYVFKKKVAPSFFGTPALVADIAAPKSEARLAVDYKITSPTTGKVLWEYKDFGRTERRPRKVMTDKKAFGYAAVKNINWFFYKAFYKERRNQ